MKDMLAKLRQRCVCGQRSEVREQAALRLEMLTADHDCMKVALEKIVAEGQVPTLTRGQTMPGPLAEIAQLALDSLWVKS